MYLFTTYTCSALLGCSFAQARSRRSFQPPSLITLLRKHSGSSQASNTAKETGRRVRNYFILWSENKLHISPTTHQNGVRNVEVTKTKKYILNTLWLWEFRAAAMELRDTGWGWVPCIYMVWVQKLRGPCTLRTHFLHLLEGTGETLVS